MANERMLIGIDIINYKNKVIKQYDKLAKFYAKESINNSGATQSSRMNLILDTYRLIIKKLDNLITLQYDSNDELSEIYNVIDNLSETVDKFVEDNVDYNTRTANFAIISTLSSNLLATLMLMEINFKNGSATFNIDDLLSKKDRLEEGLKETKVLNTLLKNKAVNEIFKDDSTKFKTLAFIYEILFYLIVLIISMYFIGVSILIPDFNIGEIKISFPIKIHGNTSIEFYIQKFSLLVLSTTLAAFLLKRSLMNRHLADEAYRTSKELTALPIYLEGFKPELVEKIRFDLAYKYFGRQHTINSDKEGENFMAENIKANTEYLKIVKDISTSTTNKGKDDVIS